MGRINVTSLNFWGASLAPTLVKRMPRLETKSAGTVQMFRVEAAAMKGTDSHKEQSRNQRHASSHILAEGAVALPVTLSGGALFAS